MPPNLRSYEAARGSFSWEQARSELDGLPGDAGLNIAHESVDRHASRQGQRVALRCIDARGGIRDISYSSLRELTDRFANALLALGVERGDRIFTLLSRGPEVHVAAMGALKIGAVFCPLFASFGPEPVASRLAIGRGRVLVTTERLYERKLAPVRDRLPDLEHVIVLGPAAPSGAHSLDELLAGAADTFTIPPTGPEDPALLHFTSGTTGAPKGALHVHEALVAQHATARFALDLRPSDTYWCTADPGWVTGTVYGIVAPLCIGASVIVDESDFDAERWLSILQDQQVSVWYTAPTALRMLMRVDDSTLGSYDTSQLRFMACVGEPLDAETVVWGQRVFGAPFHDTWWQTETGAIMISNYAAEDVKPGSMGRPVPGIEAAILPAASGEAPEPVEEPGVTGELAIRVGWPSMFRSYVGEEERYRSCFDGGWYRSGDLARRDEDGYFWFVGRADDVIQSSGHLIGPAEVEAALLEHPAVFEVGVIGRPDPVAGQIVKAFVALKPGYTGSRELRRALIAHARRRLGPAVAPRELEFRESLPKTQSGKIVRRLLGEEPEEQREQEEQRESQGAERD